MEWKNIFWIHKIFSKISFHSNRNSHCCKIKWNSSLLCSSIWAPTASIRTIIWANRLNNQTNKSLYSVERAEPTLLFSQFSFAHTKSYFICSKMVNNQIWNLNSLHHNESIRNFYQFRNSGNPKYVPSTWVKETYKSSTGKKLDPTSFLCSSSRTNCSRSQRRVLRVRYCMVHSDSDSLRDVLFPPSSKLRF